MAFDIPREAILPVDRVDVRLDPEPHPFESANLAAIDENWLREHAAQPALYDGRMMLHSDLAYVGRRIVGRCHMVRYATLLYWRHHKETTAAQHAFAHAALVSRDNALIAIRMGKHTASPGRVYFAAGSFEEPDFPDGVVDVDANMAREVVEETGLDILMARRDAHYHAYSGESGTVIFRRYWLDRSADDIAAEIGAFVATETDPEIEGAVVIRDASERPAGLARHMIAIMDWHFSHSAT
ncbi:MAG TPA: hypothetical protein VMF90_16425 [Rhizobiaceae bacterium]|nr:hypothetical protein [Rhizobiaceae bacterium]